MKKSLVALAVAAALPAFAQAQTSVQLTGSVDVALESLNSDANRGKSDLKVSDGIWGGSRFAIVGSEDLGSGLKALFNLEYRGHADTGTQATSKFWQGQSWVGLGGGFGTIRLGRQYTPVDAAIGVGDVTGQSWYYSSGDFGGGSLTNVYVNRVDNAISYQTPSLGGLQLVAAYAAGEAEATAGEDFNKLGDTMGIAGVGSWGPVSVGIGYQTIDGADIDNVKSTDQLAASLGLDLGRFGAGLGYVQKNAKAVAGDDSKTEGAYVTASFKVTDAGTIYASFSRIDPEGDNNNTEGFGLTYSHGLSKRTFVYGALGIGKEQQAGDDNKPRRIALGVRHFF